MIIVVILIVIINNNNKEKDKTTSMLTKIKTLLPNVSCLCAYVKGRGREVREGGHFIQPKLS